MITEDRPTPDLRSPPSVRMHPWIRILIEDQTKTRRQRTEMATGRKLQSTKLCKPPKWEIKATILRMLTGISLVEEYLTMSDKYERSDNINQSD